MRDWIMFYSGGEVHVDVVLHYRKDDRFPYGKHAITPHFGKIHESSIIETRCAATPDAQGVE